MADKKKMRDELEVIFKSQSKVYVDIDLLRDFDRRYGLVQDLDQIDWDDMIAVTDITTEFIRRWKETVEVVEDFRKLCKEYHFKPK